MHRGLVLLKKRKIKKEEEEESFSGFFTHEKSSVDFALVFQFRSKCFTLLLLVCYHMLYKYQLLRHVV